MNTNDPERRADETFWAAKKRLKELRQAEAEQQMKANDPAVYAFVTRVAFDALIDRFAGLPPETCSVVYDAIWHAAVLAMEAKAIHKVEPATPMGSLTLSWTHRLTGGLGISKCVAFLPPWRVRNHEVSPPGGE